MSEGHGFEPHSVICKGCGLGHVAYFFVAELLLLKKRRVHFPYSDAISSEKITTMYGDGC